MTEITREVSYQQACLNEASRLRIADSLARACPSVSSQRFDLGRKDRLSGKPCSSSNGDYIDGWYSVRKTAQD